MPIRAKLLLVLLAASLIPLAVATAISQRLAGGLGERLADEQRRRLIEDARASLLGATRHKVASFEKSSGAVLATSQLLAREIRARLGEPPPPDVTVYTPERFHPGGDAPGLRELAGLAGPDGQARLGSAEAIAVYGLTPETAPDAARAAAMLDYLRLTHLAIGLPGISQFITFASGVHAIYPGHGLLPPNADAREFMPYALARERPTRPGGTPPYVDPETGRVGVAYLVPVPGPEGGLAAIVGVRMLTEPLLGELALGEAWGQRSRAFLLTVEGPADNPEMFIIAGHQYIERSTELPQEGLDRFHADTPEETLALRDALVAHEPGTMRITIGGNPTLAAYASLAGNSLAILVLVPESAVVAPADEAAAEVRRRTTRMLGVSLALLGGVGALAGAVALWGSRTLTRPLAHLAEATRRLAAGDFESRAEIRTGDELQDLAGTFNDMVPRLREQMRMRHSLDLAQQVQRGLLPAEPPRVRGFDLAGVSRYCDETGGDYYDFLEFDQPGPGRLTIAVGDVTGHGVAAALLMATARALIRMRSTLPGEMAERLGDINRHLAGDVSLGRFMTLMLLSLDRASGVARWVGAGHDPVIVYDPATDAFGELAGEDIPLGVEADWRFHEREQRVLEAGRVLVLGTDGIWEAMNGAGEQFGKDRLRACVRRHATQPAQAIADGVLREIGAFLGPEAPRDDVTMVVIKVTEN